MGLDTVELALAVEEKFQISIPDRATEKLLPVGAMHSFVVSELGRLGRPVTDSALIFEQLKEVIVRQLGVKPSEVTLDASFVEDLRAD
jgi:acyl carrier protein